MEPVRPSILRMPLRQSEWTRETTEQQFQKEQARLQARAARLVSTHERLLSALYPEPEDTQRRQAELQQLEQLQAQARAEERQREAQMLAAFSGRPAPLSTEPVRPWAGPTLAYATDSEERRARQLFATELANENRRLVAERVLERQQQRQQQHEEERRLMALPSRVGSGQRWSLGATAASMPAHPLQRGGLAAEQQWQPPRVRAPSQPPGQAATRCAAPAAPYALHCEPSSGGGERRGGSGGGGGFGGGRSGARVTPPWACEA